MEKAFQYIKRLLVFIICVILYYFSSPYVSIFVSLPVLILIFSVIHSRITGENPPHLFAYYRTEIYFKKGGLRDLIRIMVTMFGFLYDTIIWTIWGVYLVFLLLTDLIDFLKSVLYWLIHAVLWFLRQYVPFIVFLYKLFIHYLIRWPWWLYQIAYFNIRYAFNRNSYRIALRGTFLAGLIIFIFYFLEIIVMKISGITIIGIIIALLPLSWSFGEIASLRVQKMENEAYKTVRKKFQNGLEAVRSILFYITLFVVLLLAQLGLNLLGWVPRSGIPVAGFVFNIDTLISLFLLFIGILIVLGVIVIPSFRLYSPFSEIRLSDTINLFKALLRKFLQYLIVTVPNAIFALLILVIPLVVILTAGILTYSLKNGITEIKINNLKTAQAISENPIDAYIIGKKREQLEFIKRYPRGLAQELQHMENRANEITIDQEDLKLEREELLRYSEMGKARIDTMQKQIRLMAEKNPNDPRLEQLAVQRAQLQNQIRTYEETRETELTNLQADIDYKKRLNSQLPYLFFFGGLWLVIFGSMALAFVVSYLGNIYHQVYIFRNDDSPSEWKNIVIDIRSKDSKQPLLGGTLIVITALIVYILLSEQGFSALLLSLF